MGVAAAATGLRRLSVVGAGTGVVLDVAGHQIEIDRAVVSVLQDAARARVGRSSIARDLAVLLEQVREGSMLVLRRGEAHALPQLASDAGMAGLARLLSA